MVDLIFKAISKGATKKYNVTLNEKFTNYFVFFTKGEELSYEGITDKCCPKCRLKPSKQSTVSELFYII